MTKKEPKYPPEFKKEVCDFLKEESISTASEVFKVGRNTISRWKKKYEKHGVKGFVTKRNITQPTKLNNKTLQKIIHYRNENLKSTYKEIKLKFKLDCDVSLISRKVRKATPIQVSGENSKQVFLELNTVSQVIFKNEINSVYQLAIYSKDGKLLSIGFTKTKNSRNICLFVRYSLDILSKKRKYKCISEISTRLTYINKSEFDQIVREEHKINLIVSKSEKLQKIKIQGSKNIQDSIILSYNNVFTKMNSNELEDSLLAPRINIDKLSQNKNIKWDSLSFPSENKNTLNKILKDIKKSGDQAALDFGYEVANSIYTKVFISLSKIREGNKELMVEILLKKAILFFETDELQVALMLFRDCLRFAKKHNFQREIGVIYYYFGMIYIYFANTEGALKYMNTSLKVLKNLTLNEDKCLYYRTLTKKSLIKEDFKSALEFSTKYYKLAKIANNKKLIGHSLGRIGEALYYRSEFNKSEKIFLDAKKYNIQNGFLGQVCFNIYFLIDISSHGLNKNKKTIESLYSELKKYSAKVNKPYVMYASTYSLGVYYYNKGGYILAEKFLFTVKYGTKRFIDNRMYLSALIYFANAQYKNGKFKESLRSLNSLIKLCTGLNDSINLIHGYASLAEVFFDRKDYKRAVFYFNKVIKLSKKLDLPYYTGYAYRHLAKIAAYRNYIGKSKNYCNESLKYYEKYRKINTKHDISKEIKEVKKTLNNLNTNK